MNFHLISQEHIVRDIAGYIGGREGEGGRKKERGRRDFPKGERGRMAGEFNVTKKAHWGKDN